MKKASLALFALLALAFLAGPADAQLLRRPLLPFRQVQAMPVAPVQVQQAAPKELIPPPVSQGERVQGEPVQAVRQLDAKSFAGALQKQLSKIERKSFAERRLERIINSPDSAKRDSQLDRMERHVRVHLGLSPTAAVDWGADIDWPSLLETILELLLKLLPLFL